MMYTGGNEMIKYGNIVYLISAVCIVSFIVFFTIALANADNIFKQGEGKIIVRYDKQINLSVSSKGINHLHFEDERIEKIIGDSSEYTAVVSGNGSDIFFTSKVKDGSTINLSIELSSGFIVDVFITVCKSQHPKIIFLKRYISEQDMHSNKQLEFKQMMEAMRSGKRGKYYIKNISKRIYLPCRDNLSVKQYTSYRYGNIRGAAFNIYNKDRKNKVVIKPNELAQEFKSVVLANIDHTHIAPGDNTRGFIVWEVRDVE